MLATWKYISLHRPLPTHTHARRTHADMHTRNIDFSLEKCRFGAKKGVSHYVLRRDLVIFEKSDNFELEICVKTKKGRTALQPEALLSLK